MSVKKKDTAIWIEWLYRAEAIAQTSPHPKVKVGAVLVSRRGKLITENANNFAAGVQPLPERSEDGNRSSWYECAEQTALAVAARKGISTEGAELFVTERPCHRCAGAIANAGIAYVVIPETPLHPQFKEKWVKSIRVGIEKLMESDVSLVSITLPQKTSTLG